MFFQTVSVFFGIQLNFVRMVFYMAHEYKNRPRDEAAEKIECYIIENNLKAHDRIPSERDMCAMWNINRTTLRSAITRLCDEGALYNRIGSGTFVAPKKLICNLQDIKGSSEYINDEGRELTTKLIRFQVREANKKIAKSLHLPLGSHVFEIGRLRCIDGTPGLLEYSFCDADRFKGLENYDFEKGSLYGALAKDYDVDLAQGREWLNVTYLDEEEAKLLGVRSGSPVIDQSGIVCDGTGMPAEYFRLLARPEYIRFTSMFIKDTSRVQENKNAPVSTDSAK